MIRKHDKFSVSPTLYKAVKRGTGCAQVNAATYATGGYTFDIICDTSYYWTEILFISYTVDFASCMNACVQWNIVNPEKCVSMTWRYSFYGPDGVAGGSECWFYWSATSWVPVVGQDSAKLQMVPTASPQTVDIVHRNWLILKTTPTSTVSSQPTGNTNCAPLNRTTYQASTGATYNIYCTSGLIAGEVGVSSGDLFFRYAPDFLSCLDGCAIWNTNASLTQCEGVSFDAQVYGPGGSTGGGWCVYMWGVHGPDYSEGWDSAQLKSIVRFLSILLNPSDDINDYIIFYHSYSRIFLAISWPSSHCDSVFSIVHEEHHYRTDRRYCRWSSWRTSPCGLGFGINTLAKQISKTCRRRIRT